MLPRAGVNDASRLRILFMHPHTLFCSVFTARTPLNHAAYGASLGHAISSNIAVRSQ